MVRVSFVAGISFLAAPVVVAAVSASSAQQASWVDVKVNGEVRASFLPRESQDAEDATAVGIPLPSDRVYRTQDGRAVAGLEFTGWFEDDGVKVVVSMKLIRQSSAAEAKDPDSFVPPVGVLMDEDHEGGLEERLLGVCDIGRGDAVEIPDADSLGFESLTLKAREELVTRPHPA